MSYTINTDEDFLDRMREIKSLLKDSAPLEELRSMEAGLLRNKIVTVLKYVMSKIQEEEAAKSQMPSEQEMSYEPGAPSQPGAPSELVGGKKKRARKQKGGNTLDMNRVGNTNDIGKGSINPLEAIQKSDEVAIARHIHHPFTQINASGYSSVSSLPKTQLDSILPNYGSA